MQLILCSGMLNQVLNWITRSQYCLMGLNGPCSSSYTLLAQYMKVGLTFSLPLCIRVFWKLQKVAQG